MLVAKVQSEIENCVLALLVGASPPQIEELNPWTAAEDVHVAATESLSELALFDLNDVGVILAWDEGETIERLHRQLHSAGHWLPLVAVGREPPVRRVVRAMALGAVDYIDWPSEAPALLSAIRAAHGQGGRAAPPLARQAGARDALARLSPRERQVLGLMAEGMTNKVIARTLEISPRTVEIHRAHMLEKLKSKSSADAIRLFFEATMQARAHSAAQGKGAQPSDVVSVRSGEAPEGAPIGEPASRGEG